jgi:hypothetical protein
MAQGEDVIQSPAVAAASYRITEMNQAYWRFSWKMRVRNDGAETIIVTTIIEFLDRAGAIVNTDRKPPTVISPLQTVDIFGSALIPAPAGPLVASVIGKARRTG